LFSNFSNHIPINSNKSLGIYFFPMISGFWAGPGLG